MTGGDRDFCINKVILRSRQGAPDSLVQQQQMTSALNCAEFCPSWLPGSAVLCIRRLRHPSPPSVPFSEWEYAVAGSIDDLSHSAARPSLGGVPANAEAVLFMDRSELLACLANDWCDGCVSDRWWWRSLFKSLDSKSMVLHAWLDAAEYVPAALEQLALKGAVVPFVRTLSSSDTRTVLQALTNTFALPELAASVAHIPDYLATPEVVTSHDPAASGSPERILSTPAWQRWVPECSGPGLTPLQQCLLGVGLTLARAPRVVRTVVFADGVGSWCQGAVQTGRSNVSAPSRGVMPAPSPESGVSESAADEPFLQGTTSTYPVAPANPGQSTSVSDKVQIQQLIEGDVAESSDSSNPLESVPGQYTAGNEESHEVPASYQSDFEQVMPYYEERADTASLLDVSIDTELGGLFYLINLGIFLKLYGDFTRPLQPGITLDIWDFVTLTGQQLLGDTSEADPLWPLLARFAGRSESDVPGSGFDPPDRWQLPVEWLLPFPEPGSWKWSETGRRLRVQHPEGFLLIDQPLVDGDLREQARRSTEAYEQVVPFKLERGATVRTDKGMSALERWLHRLVPYLQARLKRALGVTDAERFTHTLCQQSARVCVAAAHVDVFFALDEHPINIRLAGLDRNPGWVPAAGRFIAFHYE